MENFVLKLRNEPETITDDDFLKLNTRNNSLSDFIKYKLGGRIINLPGRKQQRGFSINYLINKPILSKEFILKYFDLKDIINYYTKLDIEEKRKLLKDNENKFNINFIHYKHLNFTYEDYKDLIINCNSLYHYTEYDIFQIVPFEMIDNEIFELAYNNEFFAKQIGGYFGQIHDLTKTLLTKDYILSKLDIFYPNIILQNFATLEECKQILLSDNYILNKNSHLNEWVRFLTDEELLNLYLNRPRLRISGFSSGKSEYNSEIITKYFHFERIIHNTDKTKENYLHFDINCKERIEKILSI